jgi:hypothetical protein
MGPWHEIFDLFTAIDNKNLHICTAVSTTPLCMWQRSQWLCCACHYSQWLCCAHHSRVNDSAGHGLVFAEKIDFVITAESMTPLCMSQWCQLLRWNFFKICISAQRSQWLHCEKNRRLQSRFSRRILIHTAKGFNPCLRELGGVVWLKKPEVENLVSGSL